MKALAAWICERMTRQRLGVRQSCAALDWAGAGKKIEGLESSEGVSAGASEGKRQGTAALQDAGALFHRPTFEWETRFGFAQAGRGRIDAGDSFFHQPRTTKHSTLTFFA